MISFDNFKSYIDAYKEQMKAENMIRDGFAKMDNDTFISFNNKVGYWEERMFEQAIGTGAYDVLMLWMWDYNMGTECPPPDEEYETLYSDIKEFFEKDLMPLMKDHIRDQAANL